MAARAADTEQYIDALAIRVAADVQDLDRFGRRLGRAKKYRVHAERSDHETIGSNETATDQLVTNGGRILNVVGTGATVAEARSTAYEAAAHIDFAGMHLRTDIAANV